MSNYIPFHTHDCLGSILDSTLKLEDYVKWAKANNIPAIGVTNHGNLTSTLKLVNLCKKNNIKPLVGIEFYITENELDENGKRIRDNHHLCALAKNKNGYHNLIKLHNLSYREERYYYDGRITFEDLINYKNDLIITSACIGGVLGRCFLNNDLEKAENRLKLLYDNFGEDFYLEFQNHNSLDEKKQAEQEAYNKWLLKMSKKYGVKCIIQQDAHYYLPEHWKAHSVLLAKNMGKKLSTNTFQFDSHEYYCKNEVEILEAFNNYPLSFVEECFRNTKEIADKVEEYEIANKNYTMPTFGQKNEVCNKLKELVKKGFVHRFGKPPYKKEYVDRIKYEFEVIEKMNMQDYVYMLYDVYRYAEEQGIYRSYGRGSMGASLILYCLGITQLDPIKYHLMLERFISPDRISMMDADCDWAPDDKPKIEKYLRDKYGWDSVCGISTYNELTAKSAFKAVASILDVPFSIANKISGYIDPDISLKDNFNQSKEFNEAIIKNNLQEVYDIALIIEGTYSARGQHPCANVIFPKSFDEFCPVVTMKDPNDSKNRVYVTSYDMKEIDGELKLLKQDNLGLRNIQIIREADKFIEKRHGIKIDYHKLDINDKEVYDNLSKGNNLGVFQFESSMFKSLLMEVKPKCLEDLAVITAIGRPSALQSGLTQQYKDIRAGKSNPEYVIPELEEPLKNTFGLMIFQESMMLTLKYYAGFTNSQADMARKICGKKLKDKIPELKSMYLEGAKNMGRNMDEAEELFEKIQQFASYGFSLIHALLYSLMSYATAWYKTHYPVEYMCAVLNSVPDDLEKLNLYIGECFRLGVPILPPDINVSNENFTIDNDGKIRFGLSAIKGLGKSAVSQIINTRKNKPFTSIEDFIDRTSKVDKSNIQSLLKVGAFNNIEPNPKRWDKLCDYINDAKKSKEYSGTANLDRIIYDIIGTKKAKKSDKYLDLQQQKRELGSSKKYIIKKEELNEQQENIIRNYCDTIEKYYLQFTKYTPAEKIESEQELLGFNISTNPYQRWDKFKKIYSKNNASIPFVELTELLNNPDKYLSYKNIHTVALLHDIKEIKTKKGDRMAKITLDYFGHKITTTVFSSQWQNNLENKIQKGNLVAITGRLLEANKQFSIDDYEFKLDTMRQLNVLVNENNKCIIDKDKFDYNTVVEKIRIIASKERQEFLPVERVVMFKCGNGKFNILDGIYWINDPNKIAQFL